jgi:hypothetical protein
MLIEWGAWDSPTTSRLKGRGPAGVHDVVGLTVQLLTLTPYPPRVLGGIDDTRLAIQEGSAMSKQALTEASYPSGE